MRGIYKQPLNLPQESPREYDRIYRLALSHRYNIMKCGKLQIEMDFPS
jgi:hypothetical protein